MSRYYVPDSVKDDPAYTSYYKQKKSAEEWRRKKKRWLKKKRMNEENQEFLKNQLVDLLLG